jgi:hypothetical protein
VHLFLKHGFVECVTDILAEPGPASEKKKKYVLEIVERLSAVNDESRNSLIHSDVVHLLLKTIKFSPELKRFALSALFNITLGGIT